MAKLLFGCSGWSYKEWVGSLYLDEAESKLSAYSNIFNTSEINSTFYTYPKKGMVLGWLKHTPRDFVFSAKIPGQITHDKKLIVDKGVEEDLSQFLQLMEPLANGGKLGCYIIQLPKGVKFAAGKAESFYAILPQRYKFAMEFRNKSWLCDESFKLLSKYNIAYTVLDEPLLPPDVKLTAGFTYYRWHGRGEKPWYDYLYSEEELREWVPKIEEARENVSEIYGYFNNHYHGYAPENCLDILNMLGVATPLQNQIRERIKQYRRETPKPIPTSQLTLKSVKGKTSRTGVKEGVEGDTESMLRLFADEGRILRGRVIKEDELKDVKIEGQRISAKIRDYDILIDLGERIIQHNCDDWKKMKNKKRFCKHIVKLLLTLPEEKSQMILSSVSENSSEWRFE